MQTATRRQKIAIEQELRKWEAEGIIERCDSEWASPVHAVHKPDGSWRVCRDFRRINLATQPDRYPLPSLTNFNDNLAGCTFFSKNDSRRAYQQVCINEKKST